MRVKEQGELTVAGGVMMLSGAIFFLSMLCAIGIQTYPHRDVPGRGMQSEQNRAIAAQFASLSILVSAAVYVASQESFVVLLMLIVLDWSFIYYHIVPMWWNNGDSPFASTSSMAA
jgi:hypothetical protein